MAIDTIPALENIRAARIWLIHKRPYFTSAVFALNIKKSKSEDMTTLAVDKRWNLYYHEEFTEKQPMEELAAILVHEISHLLRHHHVRAENINAYPKLWNYAADAEINDDLKADGLKLPEWVVLPSNIKTPSYPDGMPDNLLAEEYYNMLLPDVNFIKVLVNCGSCAHGQEEPWEDELGNGLTEGEAELVRRQVAADIAKYPGTVPGYLQQWADEVLGTPKIDWRKELFSVVSSSSDAYKAGSSDYTFTRRSKRHHASDIIFPSMFDLTPKIAIGIDTSESTAEVIPEFMAETSGILLALGQTSVRVLSCDSEVHEDVVVSDIWELRDKIVGGGGTNMGAIIEHLEKDINWPNICIILTDGYTPWPDKAPSFTVIAVITSDQSVPSWIKAIYLDGVVR